MKTPLVVAFLSLFTVVVFAEGPVRKERPTPVAHVDLSRYQGLWYEIAKIPNRFQDHCKANATAHYTLRDNGKMDVINRCLDQNGEYDEASGIAKGVDSQSNAELKVSFLSFLGFSLFWGDYWIIELHPNYNYVVVGTPDREYGWILSRSSGLSNVTRDLIDAKLRSQGYDPNDFENTKHQ